jgi:hypothetical protein
MAVELPRLVADIPAKLLSRIVTFSMGPHAFTRDPHAVTVLPAMVILALLFELTHPSTVLVSRTLPGLSEI